MLQNLTKYLFVAFICLLPELCQAKGTCSPSSPKNACGACNREGDCGGTGRGKFYCHRSVNGCGNTAARSSNARVTTRANAISLSKFKRLFARQHGGDHEFTHTLSQAAAWGDVNSDGYPEFVTLVYGECQNPMQCGHGIDQILNIYSYRSGKVVKIASEYASSSRNAIVSFSLRGNLIYLKVESSLEGDSLSKLKLVGRKLVRVR